MKVFRDNKCFVSFKDLVDIGFPKKLNYDKDSYKDDEYVTLNDSEDIDYIRNREDIIDYDSVYSLSNEELDNKIGEIEKELEPLYIQFSSTSLENKMLLFKDEDFKNNIFKLDKIYYDLIHYKNNRINEDDKILYMIFISSLGKGLSK